jgi:hypothetical protein
LLLPVVSVVDAAVIAAVCSVVVADAVVIVTVILYKTEHKA